MTSLDESRAGSDFEMVDVATPGDERRQQVRQDLEARRKELENELKKEVSEEVGAARREKELREKLEAARRENAALKERINAGTNASSQSWHKPPPSFTCGVRLLDAGDAEFRRFASLQVDPKTSLESLLNSALEHFEITGAEDQQLYDCVKLEQHSTKLLNWIEIDASSIAMQHVENGTSYSFTLAALCTRPITRPIKADNEPYINNETGNREAGEAVKERLGRVSLTPKIAAVKDSMGRLSLTPKSEAVEAVGEWVNALGWRPELGDYYDAATLTYHSSAGKRSGRIKEESLEEGKTSWFNSERGNGRPHDERFFSHGDHFAQLGITGEEKLNILSGVRTVSGAGKFLNDLNLGLAHSAGKHIVSAIYKLRYKATRLEITKREWISLGQAPFPVTHLVKSIVCGGVFVFSFILDDPKVRYSAYTEGELKKMIIESIHSGRMAFDSPVLRQKVKVRVFADNEFNLPGEMDIDQAIATISDLSRIVEEANGGVPILYEMLPLKPVDSAQPHSPINPTISNEIIGLLTEANQIADRVRAVLNEVNSNLHCLPISARGAVAELHRGSTELLAMHDELNSRSAQLIQEIRAMEPPPNYVDLAVLESVKDEFQRLFSVYLDSIQYPVMQRVERFQQLQRHGVEFITPCDQNHLQNFINSHRECFVLFSAGSGLSSCELNRKNEQFFGEIIGGPAIEGEIQRNFAFVDLTLTANLADCPEVVRG